MGDLHLALLGHGTVGAEVARLLFQHRDEYQSRLGRRLNVKWILVRNKAKHPTTSFAGATITPRAVVKAVHQALQYFDAHRDELFAQEIAR